MYLRAFLSLKSAPIADKTTTGYVNILIYRHKLQATIPKLESNKFHDMIFAIGSQKCSTYNDQKVATSDIANIIRKYFFICYLK